MQRRKSNTISRLWIWMVLLTTMGASSAKPLVIDDRSSGDLTSNLGASWRMVTDSVMGGVSQGRLSLDTYQGRDCLRMRGDVSTDNNGGFVQIMLNLAEDDVFDASRYDGLELEVAGNSESYNLHLRTSGLWLPWQSFRFSFDASPGWRRVRVPFDALSAYRTMQAFDPQRLKRIGLVAIGREFDVDLCLASVSFYEK